MPPAAVQDEVRFLQAKLADRLFLKIGVTTGDLQFHVDALKLSDDEEFIKIVEDYNQVVQMLQKD